MGKEKCSLGVKIICAALLLVVVSGVLQAVISIALLHLPHAEKVRWIQTNKDAMKLLNVTSVEQFDRFFHYNVMKTTAPLTIIINVIILIISFGLLKRKKWAKTGIIALSALTILHSTYFLWSQVSANAMHLLGKVISLPLHGAIILYLISPKVREQFR